jgi:hypothetical protein
MDKAAAGWFDISVRRAGEESGTDLQLSFCGEQWGYM